MDKLKLVVLFYSLCLVSVDGFARRKASSATRTNQPSKLISQTTEEEVLSSHPAPEPYSFAYSVDGKDALSTREERGDKNGRVVGSYMLLNANGTVRRVDYVADDTGFHATIITDEQGTQSKSHPADVKIYKSASEKAEDCETCEPANDSIVASRRSLEEKDVSTSSSDAEDIRDVSSKKESSNEKRDPLPPTKPVLRPKRPNKKKLSRLKVNPTKPPAKLQTKVEKIDDSSPNSKSIPENETPNESSTTPKTENITTKPTTEIDNESSTDSMTDPESESSTDSITEIETLDDSPTNLVSEIDESSYLEELPANEMYENLDESPSNAMYQSEMLEDSMFQKENLDDSLDENLD